MKTKRFGIVLPSWIYKPERRALADEAFRTLNRTNTLLFEQKPKLLVVSNGTWGLDLSGVFGFDWRVVDGHGKAKGTEQSLAWGTAVVLEETNVDFIVWLGDDAKFHPEWLNQLSALIDRHPDARSWNVYRSAYETYHRPVAKEGLDVQTTCLCGHGLTFSRQEWEEWGIDWKTGNWPSPAGDTLDLHHSWKRPGERWCTKLSYIEHTGKVGMHCTGVEPEYAVNFQGTGE